MLRRTLTKKQPTDPALEPVTNALTDWTDEQLMDQLHSGRLSCGAVLFERYHRKLYNYFLRRCRRTDWSEDLLQITFERVIRYRQSYRRGQSFRAWLYQIARHRLTDYRQRHGRELDSLSDNTYRIPHDVSVNEQLESSEESAALQQALASLPEDYREVLLLTRYQGMRYREAGEVMGISEGAVKVKVHRALQKLRSIYLKSDR